MNKKILIGLSVVGAAAGFWACGDGDVITKGGEDEMVLAAYTLGTDEESTMKDLVKAAMDSCSADPTCAAKMEGATYVPPESSAEGGDTPTPESSDSNGGSGQGPVSSSALKPVITSNTSTETSSGSTNPTPTSSAAAATDPNDLSGSCKASVQSIKEGGSVTWTFTVGTLSGAGVTELLDYQNRVKAATCNWTVAGGTVTAGNVAGTCGGDGKTVTATYAEIGDYKTSIKLGEKTIDCGTVAVAGPDVTGCECTVDEANPDVKGGDVTVTWTVSSCKAGSDTPNEDWKWAWTGATGLAASATATVSKKGDTKTASVKVTSAKNASMNVTCPQVKAVNSDLPDYEIGGTGITVPNGACGVATTSGQLRIEHAYVGSSCTVGLTIAGTEYAAETRSDCNIYYGVLSFDGTNVSSGQQICVTATGSASDVTLKIQ